MLDKRSSNYNDCFLFIQRAPSRQRGFYRHWLTQLYCPTSFQWNRPFLRQWNGDASHDVVEYMLLSSNTVQILSCRSHSHIDLHDDDNVTRCCVMITSLHFLPCLLPPLDCRIADRGPHGSRSSCKQPTPGDHSFSCVTTVITSCTRKRLSFYLDQVSLNEAVTNFLESF